MKKEIKEKTAKDYPSLDDWFVDKYLRHDDETIEEAKQRVIKEQEESQKNRENKKQERCKNK